MDYNWEELKEEDFFDTRLEHIEYCDNCGHVARVLSQENDCAEYITTIYVQCQKYEHPVEFNNIPVN